MRNSDEPSALAAALGTIAGAAQRLAAHLARRVAQGSRRAVQRAARAARARLAAWEGPTAQPNGTTVIPTVRYRDVPKAVKWLCRAFGMRVHRVVRDANGAPRYAELTVGSGMLIVAPIEDTPLGRLMVQPDDIGGVETQVCYLYVANPYRHCARAKAAGAAIVLDLEDAANKGRGYSCRDPEGHLWNFGTYDPWRAQPAPPVREAWNVRRVQNGMAAALLMALGALLLAQAIPQPSARAGTAMTEPASLHPVPKPPEKPASALPRVEPVKAVVVVPDPEAERQRAALEAAERTLMEARSQLADARGALAKAEREATAVRSQLDELQRAKLAAERAAAEARMHLAAAQKEADRARTAAELERARRVAARRAMVRAWRRASGRSERSARYWCYNAYGPNAVTAGGRLSGFCKS